MRRHTFLQIVFHIIGCFLFLALPILTSPDFPASASLLRNRPTQRDLLGYVLMILFFYFNYFLLIPRFYFTKKYLLFFCIVLLCFLVVSAMPRILLPVEDLRTPFADARSLHAPPVRRFSPPLPNEKTPPPPVGRSGRNGVPAKGDSYVFNVIRYLFIFLALVFFSLILQINNWLKRVEKDKLNTELLYLKAQINPHFLFNSLNTIYSLSVADRSVNTSAAVLKLSQMMRYVTHETGRDFVSLKEEINYVTNYLALQKVRFDNLVEIRFVQNGDTTGKKIAPLLLIPFIENAFKYGIDAQEENIINIEIDVDGSNLQLLVSNKKANMSPVESSGIGLSNTKNRLQLLYPARHTLLIKNEEVFFVSLSLVLS